MSDTKLTILLAVALFMISAPEPDSATIAELSAHFIVPASERALLASEREIETAPAQALAVAPTHAAPAPISAAHDGSGSGEPSVGPG